MTPAVPELTAEPPINGTNGNTNGHSHSGNIQVNPDLRNPVASK